MPRSWLALDSMNISTWIGMYSTFGLFLGDSNLEDKPTVPDVHNFGFMTSILIKLPIAMCI